MGYCQGLLIHRTSEQEQVCNGFLFIQSDLVSNLVNVQKSGIQALRVWPTDGF